MYSFGGFDDGLVNGTWCYLFGGGSANRLCKDSGVFFYVMAPACPKNKGDRGTSLNIKTLKVLERRKLIMQRTILREKST